MTEQVGRGRLALESLHDYMNNEILRTRQKLLQLHGRYRMNNRRGTTISVIVITVIVGFRCRYCALLDNARD